MARWPHDDPASLAAFYGDPNTGAPGRQLVPVTPPFKMYYDGKPITHVMFHSKAAGALLAAFNEIWEYYEKNQAKIDVLGISKFSGSYNPRKIRGSATRWSNHAYGAAIDLNAEHNSFNTGRGDMPQPVIDAFKSQGALWGGDYKNRTDPMHFEFCSRGESPPAPRIPVEAPQTDTDVAEQDERDDAQSDINDAAPAVVPAVVPPVATPEPDSPWYSKAWNWVSGIGGVGAVGGVGSWFSGVTPVTIAIVLGFAFAVFCIIWFTKKGKGW